MLLAALWALNCLTLAFIVTEVGYLQFVLMNGCIVLCSQFIDSIALGILAVVTKIDVRLKYTNYTQGVTKDGQSKTFVGNYFILRYASEILFRIIGNYLSRGGDGLRSAYFVLALFPMILLVSSGLLFFEVKVSCMCFLSYLK